MNTAIIFSLLIVLMLTGMPISIALGLTVLSFLFVMTTVPIESVALKLFTGIESFEIMAIPFFILAGNFLTHGGVARRMINFAASMVGHWYGGLGLAAVVACALFAEISGSSPATVVAIGSILIPAMVDAGYPKRFGAGVIATSGALGILIPPSIVMVLFAVSTGGSVALDPEGKRVLSASVGQLFMAGVIPGLMLAFLLALVGYGTKVGLVPMHTWLPDAHAEAPAPVSAMLSGALLNAAINLGSIQDESWSSLRRVRADALWASAATLRQGVWPRLNAAGVVVPPDLLLAAR